MNLDPSQDTYIPNARDCVVAVIGREIGGGRWRTHCNACLESHPLEKTEDVYGERSDADYRGTIAESCDVCCVWLSYFSKVINDAHDAQQARWARESRIEYVSEMGAVAGIRCRVY